MQKCYVLMKESQWRPIYGPVTKANAVMVFMDKKEAKNTADMLNSKARDYWYSVKGLPFNI